jgi:hypothetical protein
MALSPHKFLKIKDIDATAGLQVSAAGEVRVVLSQATNNTIAFDGSGALFSPEPAPVELSTLPNNAISLIAGQLYAPTVTSTTGVFTRLPAITATAGQTDVPTLGLPSTYAPTLIAQNSGLLVFVNGVVQSMTGYTQYPDHITFTTPLEVGDQVDILFIGGEFTSGSAGPSPLVQRFGQAIALNQSSIEWVGFTAPLNVDVNRFVVHIDGVYQSPIFDYAVTLNVGVPTFTFSTAFPSMAQVDITY